MKKTIEKLDICTLNETASVMKKRQEIGRGLSIAVNQDGDRVHGSVKFVGVRHRDLQLYLPSGAVIPCK